MPGMFKYWLKIMRRVPPIMAHAVHRLEAWHGVVIFVALGMVSLLGIAAGAEKVQGFVDSLYGWPVATLLSVVFLYLVMRAVYEEHHAVEMDRDRWKAMLDDKLSNERTQNEKRTIKRDLAEIISSGIDLSMREVKSELDYEMWKTDFVTFLVKARTWITKEFGEHEADVRMSGTVHLGHFRNQYNADHNKQLSELGYIYVPALKSLYERLE